MTKTVQALHALIGACHLELAGVRRMTDAEYLLAADLSDWYDRRRGRPIGPDKDIQ